MFTSQQFVHLPKLLLSGKNFTIILENKERRRKAKKKARRKPVRPWAIGRGRGLIRQPSGGQIKSDTFIGHFGMHSPSGSSMDYGLHSLWSSITSRTGICICLRIQNLHMHRDRHRHLPDAGPTSVANEAETHCRWTECKSVLWIHRASV